MPIGLSAIFDLHENHIPNRNHEACRYIGEGFAVFHGSWNRTFRTGYKVVRVRMKNGVSTGEYQDFMVGFIVGEGDVWGRPVAAAIANDGSLLISDDGLNVVYRISYSKG